MRKMIATAVALVAAVPASATTILQTKTITAAAPASSTVSFLKFDSLLGTLNSVTLGFTSSLSAAAGSIYNPSQQSKTITFTKGGTETLTGNGFNLLSTLGSGSQNVQIAGKSTYAIAPISLSGSASGTLNSALAAFIGSGNLDFAFASASQYAVSGPGQLTLSPLLGANVSLTYDYTAAPPPPPSTPAVPEPATWAMMIAGFGIAGMAMRRRVNKVAFAA